MSLIIGNDFFVFHKLTLPPTFFLPPLPYRRSGVPGCVTFFTFKTMWLMMWPNLRFCVQIWDFQCLPCFWFCFSPTTTYLRDSSCINVSRHLLLPYMLKVKCVACGIEDDINYSGFFFWRSGVLGFNCIAVVWDKVEEGGVQSPLFCIFNPCYLFHVQTSSNFVTQ